MSTTTTAVGRLEVLLASAIADGRLPAGTDLREEALAARHGVSRNTVRAAVARLVAAGLVEQPAYHSARVRTLDADDVRDLFATRRLIELEALRRVIDGDGPLLALSAVVNEIDRLEAARRTDHPSSAEVSADVRFHHALVEAAGSPRLLRAFEVLAAETRLAFVHLAAVPSVAGEHRAMLRAIEARDVARAERLLDEHLRDGLRVCLAAALAPSTAT